MKFNFKIQQYQTDAVNAVVKVFSGQGFHEQTKYIRDRGESVDEQIYQTEIPDNDIGFKNDEITLSDAQLLQNIHKLQSENNIKLSPELVKDLGRCALDVEMETGTGKTYVYIKTMFELNKVYCWIPFIVVFPSIAILSFVNPLFDMLSDHFL